MAGIRLRQTRSYPGRRQTSPGGKGGAAAGARKTPVGSHRAEFRTKMQSSYSEVRLDQGWSIPNAEKTGTGEPSLAETRARAPS